MPFLLLWTSCAAAQRNRESSDGYVAPQISSEVILVLERKKNCWTPPKLQQTKAVGYQSTAVSCHQQLQVLPLTHQLLADGRLPTNQLPSHRPWWSSTGVEEIASTSYPHGSVLFRAGGPLFRDTAFGLPCFAGHVPRVGPVVYNPEFVGAIGVAAPQLRVTWSTGPRWRPPTCWRGQASLCATLRP